MARLLVVRHAESRWNAEHRWQGQADPPLSARGRRQAMEAAGRFDATDVVWSSDLARARQTAEILAAGAVVRVDARLREREAGSWTGLTREEIETRFPGYLADGLRPPGWEPDEAVQRRAAAALNDIGATAGGVTALVVTHGGVLRAVEALLGGEPETVPNLGGRWIERTSAGLVLGERVVLVTTEVTVPRQM